MTALLQNSLVVAIVAIASAYIALRLWRWMTARAAGGCASSGCHGCASNQASKIELISLELPSATKRS